MSARRVELSECINSLKDLRSRALVRTDDSHSEREGQVAELALCPLAYELHLLIDQDIKFKLLDKMLLNF